jgi:hypothetical protein
MNANILYGFVGSDPTSNLGIASKHYVDAAMANVPSGGSDLQNIIDAKGDLLVGTGPNTATRLPVGTDGQILIADSTIPNTGLRWIDVAGQEVFNNLWVQTHYDLSGNDHVVILRYAGEIIMNDGTRTSGWQNKTADIEISGAGGLDTGVEGASHWYEVHAIRNSSNGANSLILHRATEVLLDQSFVVASDTSRPLNKITGGKSLLAQSFVPAANGPLTSVELEVARTGSPTGLIWVTLESDNTPFPSGTILATSRVMDVSRLPTDKARIRFLFDTNTSVSIGTTYHIVYHGNYTASDTNYTSLSGLAAGGYASGIASEQEASTLTWATGSALGGASDFWFKTFIRSTPITAVTLPTGYDQRCLISYVYNDSNGKFKQYVQKNRTMVMGVSSDWRCFTSLTGLIEAVDLSGYVPPVTCSVQFYHWLTGGSPKTHVPIGGVASTDMPIIEIAGSGTPGSVTCNTRNQLTTVTNITLGPYGMIVVEDQVVLTRMQNVNCRLYTTAVLF